MKLNKVRIDTEKAVGGIWADWVEGARLLVARWGNPEHQAAMEAVAVENSGKQNADELFEKAQQALAGEFVLLGWDGIEDEDGTPIPYSKETSIEWLQDPELGDLYNTVKIIATRAENYRKGEEAALGN
jgi:hypothetical protein